MVENFYLYEKLYDGKYIAKYQILDNDRYETYIVVKDGVISIEEYKNGELMSENKLAFLQKNSHVKL